MITIRKELQNKHTKGRGFELKMVRKVVQKQNSMYVFWTNF